MRAKIKRVKCILRKNGEYQNYYATFRHRQMRFLASKVILLFTPLPAQQLAEIEIALARNPSLAHFKTAFKIISTKGKWDAFGLFFYYIYQTSAYKYDQKSGRANVFALDPVVANARKRNHYNTWMESLDFTNPITSPLVRKVLRLVF